LGDGKSVEKQNSLPEKARSIIFQQLNSGKKVHNDVEFKRCAQNYKN